MAYEKLKPFRYWVQKVLPEIYDDSLSYYELLNKVVSYLNTAMDNVNTLSENVTSIYNTVVELQQYVSEHIGEAVEEAIDEYFRTHAFVGSVTVEQNVSEGVKIGSVNVDGVITELFCPEAGGVSVDQVVTSGVEIAGVTIGGVRTPIFATGVSANADVHTGTKIGDVTIGGEVVEFYAPDGGGVSFSPTLTTGVEIGVITIGGNSIRMFAPSGGGGSGAVDSVNGKIGDVVLTAEDVGARSDTWIPTATEVGALPNTVTALPNPHKLVFTGSVSAEYDGSEEISVNIGGGAGGNVDSVNGKTGAVVLNASDVGAVSSNQGSGNAGAFLVVGSDGGVTTRQLATWNGGSY